LLNRINHIKEKYYNSVIARFLGSDSVLQNPYSTQPACRNASTGRNYNRYSYVLPVPLIKAQSGNNPLKYNDPSEYQFERLKDRFETEVFDERENNGSLWAKYQGKDLRGDRSNSHWADYSDWSQVKYPGEYDYEQEQAINLALSNIAFLAEMAFYTMNQQELHYYGPYNPRPDGNPAANNGGNKKKPLLEFVGFHRGIPEFESRLMPGSYSPGYSGVTPGPFIIYSSGDSDNPNLNRHEPGHVVQFLLLGGYSLYIPLVAIPSLITAGKPYHNDMPWETSANWLWETLTGEKVPINK